MNQRINDHELRLTPSPATARLSQAVDYLCRERDSELFKIQRASFEYRDKLLEIETAYKKLVKENETLSDQSTRKDGEVLHVRISFFLYGAIVASISWYAGVFVV